MASESFIIPYPESKAEKSKWSKEYGMNAYYAGKHWSARQFDAEYWHLMVMNCMNRQKVRRVPFEKPVAVVFYWNDRLDIDNHAVMGKMIVDAMKGRVIVDDTRRWLKGVSHFFHDENCIRVEVQEVA